MAAAKRARIEQAQIPEEEKEPKLKCHEMRLIFQRLPTSELIRFISKQPKHPLGKFWSKELKFIVENRLPFSVKATATPDGAVSTHVIFDSNGSRVAKIKRPKLFRLSPICELIESADVPAIATYTFSCLPPQFVFPTPDILSALSNLDTLVLSSHHVTCSNLQDPVDIHVALNPTVASRIHSLTLAHHNYYDRLEKPLAEIISRATSLKKLSWPCLNLSWRALLAALPNSPGDCSSLETLRVKRLDTESVQPLLQMISARFNGLRELFLPVRVPIRQYLAAFQALPGLATLGLFLSPSYSVEENEKELAVDASDLPTDSVTELYVAWESSDRKQPRALLAMLLKFPNVRTFGADFHAYIVPADYNRRGNLLLQFCSAVCLSGVFTHLQTLKLFCNGSPTRDSLLPFIRSNIDHLPNSVDLSQVATDCPRTVDREFLVDFCLALQGGNITSLALKDVIHRQAVPRLREHFALTKQDKSTPDANVGKVLAWIDEGSAAERRRRIRSAPWRLPQAVSEFTDFRIEARKTSGPLKGSAFKVRISDWTEKRERFFD